LWEEEGGRKQAGVSAKFCVEIRCFEGSRRSMSMPLFSGSTCGSLLRREGQDVARRGYRARHRSSTRSSSQDRARQKVPLDATDTRWRCFSSSDRTGRAGACRSLPRSRRKAGKALDPLPKTSISGCRSDGRAYRLQELRRASCCNCPHPQAGKGLDPQPKNQFPRAAG
jgi:hypothetical protein